MNIVIPMAGMGKRMRPHTLTVPKPLLPIAGKPIVHRLVEDIAAVCGQPVENIGFVVGHFGEAVEQSLLDIAASVGAKGHIFYQEEALGTAHAVLCAQEVLQGNVIVAFADTLFKADFTLDAAQDGIVWVQQVEDPSAFGVVQLNEEGSIVDFVEKPQTFVSDKAIIGIYYFKKGEDLKTELQYLIDNDLKVKGEFQLTDALQNLKLKGATFKPGVVVEWLDCGNKDATVHTNQRYLEYIKDQDLIAATAKIENSVIIPPVYIGEHVQVSNSVIGPHVSLGNGSKVSDSRISNSIIQQESMLANAQLSNSMVGNHVRYQAQAESVSIGDYTTFNS